MSQRTQWQHLFLSLVIGTLLDTEVCLQNITCKHTSLFSINTLIKLLCAFKAPPTKWLTRSTMLSPTDSHFSLSLGIFVPPFNRVPGAPKSHQQMDFMTLKPIIVEIG